MGAVTIPTAPTAWTTFSTVRNSDTRRANSWWRGVSRTVITPTPDQLANPKLGTFVRGLASHERVGGYDDMATPENALFVAEFPHIE